MIGRRGNVKKRIYHTCISHAIIIGTKCGFFFFNTLNGDTEQLWLSDTVDLNKNVHFFVNVLRNYSILYCGVG